MAAVHESTVCPHSPEIQPFAGLPESWTTLPLKGPFQRKRCYDSNLDGQCYMKKEKKVQSGRKINNHNIKSLMTEQQLGGYLAGLSSTQFW